MVVRGIEAASEALAQRVGDRINGKVDELRTRLTDPDLPDVNSVVSFDGNRIAMEEWPAVMVVPQKTVRMVFQNTDGVDETYNVRYQLQVFVWVRGDDEPSTAINRYRLTLALRETLIESRIFGDYELDITTFVESFSDVMQDEDTKATIAGAYIQLELTADETLTRGTKLGTADTAEVNTGLLPPHPALS